jgi:hypothetical protein
MRSNVSVLGALVGLGALVSCVRPPATADSAPSALVELPLVALVAHDTIPTGTIRGRLSIDDPALTAAGATVELPDAGLSARVDTAGAFELRGVPPGRQRLRARRIGAEATVGSVDVPARGGSVLRVRLELRKFCLDYCPSTPPRAFGRVEAVP